MSAHTYFSFRNSRYFFNVAAAKGRPGNGGSCGSACSGCASIESEAPHAGEADTSITSFEDGKELSDMTRHLHAVFNEHLLLSPKTSEKMAKCYGKNTLVLQTARPSSDGSAHEGVGQKDAGSGIFTVCVFAVNTPHNLLTFAALRVAAV